MEERTKYIHSQDAYFKVAPKKSGETSLNLSSDILNFITDGTMNADSERSVKFRIFKEDMLKALASIVNALPLYVSSSKECHEENFSIAFFEDSLSRINKFFGTEEEKDYEVNLLFRKDGRIYLNGLKVNGFSIRNFLIEEKSELHFIKQDGILYLRLESNHEITEGERDEDDTEENEETLSRQIIYYGAPGTGKSYAVKRITGETDGGEKENVFRTTFHPDTDYASFVGCYKPAMKEVPEKYRAVAGHDTEISYEFVPQVFTEAYVYAYEHRDETAYLVIEEINRGNCAQIFGDLFQLLDRNEEGVSEYAIRADVDLKKHLESVLGKDSEGIRGGKLRLPENLHILATMNTSDQSLFPMDSAFKRRWDWQYVPISYTEEKSSQFEIDIDGEKYSWVEFIKAVNEKIVKITQSEDKQMGNFFIKSSVNAEQFKSKVMFYLWNEVLRDEVENSNYFFYSDKSANEDNKFTFKDLYEPTANETLKGFMAYLEITAQE